MEREGRILEGRTFEGAEREERIFGGDERRGILGGEEEHVLCLIYCGCCRGSVESSVRKRELYAGGKLDFISFFGK